MLLRPQPLLMPPPPPPPPQLPPPPPLTTLQVRTDDSTTTTTSVRRRRSAENATHTRSESLLSRSLGGPTLGMTRSRSECASITYAGYLFKRSNKPFRTANPACFVGISTSRPQTPVSVRTEIPLADYADTAMANATATATATAPTTTTPTTPTTLTTPTTATAMMVPPHTETAKPNAAATEGEGTDQVAIQAVASSMGPQHLFGSKGGDAPLANADPRGVKGDDPAGRAISLAAGFFGCGDEEEDDVDADAAMVGTGGAGAENFPRWWHFGALRVVQKLNVDGSGADATANARAPPLECAALLRANGTAVAAAAVTVTPLPSAAASASSSPRPCTPPPSTRARHRTSPPIPIATSAVSSAATRRDEKGTIPIPIPIPAGAGSPIPCPTSLPPPQPNPPSLHRYDSAPATVAGSFQRRPGGRASGGGGGGGVVVGVVGVGVGGGVGRELLREPERATPALADASSHSGGIHGPPPADFIDPVDGHIWRARYCVLEDGVLYFYRNAVVGESMEAQIEREQMNLLDSLPPNGCGSWGEASGLSGIVGGGGFGVGITVDGIDAVSGGGGAGKGGGGRHDLSKSPVPGGKAHPLLAAAMRAEGVAGNSFCYDSRVIIEKRVALDCVGEVRSAELEYGERSFELLAIEEAEDGAVDADEDDDDDNDDEVDDDGDKDFDGDKDVGVDVDVDVDVDCLMNGDYDDETKSVSDVDSRDGANGADGAGSAPAKPRRKPRIEDRLVLRATSSDDMNEWLFQFHRSLASFMKEIVDLVADEAAGNRQAGLAGDIHMFRRPLSLSRANSPVFGSLHSPLAATAAAAAAAALPMSGGAKCGSKKPSSVIRSCSPGGSIAGKSSASPPTVLSHGHGRSGLHRQRVRAAMKTDGRLSSLASPASTPGGGSSPVLSKSLGDGGYMGYMGAAMSVDRNKIRANRLLIAASKRGGATEFADKRLIQRPDECRTEGGSEETAPLSTMPLPPFKGWSFVETEKLIGSGGAKLAPPRVMREALVFDNKETKAAEAAAAAATAATAATPEAAAEVGRPKTPVASAEGSPAKLPKVGKYVPPHLRNKGAVGPKNGGGGGGGGGGKYVPPHLRNKNEASRRPPPPTPPCDPDERPRASGGGQGFSRQALQDSDETIFEISVDDVGTSKAATESLRAKRPNDAPLDTKDDDKRAEDEVKRQPDDDSGASEYFNRGGCADPKMAIGSILEPVYIPKKESRIGNFHTDGFGSEGGDYKFRKSSERGDGSANRLRWEVGAISRCGIRESNEDSYLISNDLLGAFAAHRSSGTEAIEDDGGGEKKEEGRDAGKKDDDDDEEEEERHHGLFAIFDGHCGNQAARFAAEKLPFYLMEEYDAMDSSGRSYVEERAEQALTRAFARLDADFCRLCQADGREWDCGATALVVLVVGDALVVANLGDSRGVLCKASVSSNSGNVISGTGENGRVAHPEDISEENGWKMLELDSGMPGNVNDPAVDSEPTQVFFRVVTPVHSPSRPDEKIRIEAANGWITTETEIPIKVQLQRMDFYDPDVVDILKRCFADRLKDQHSHESKRCSAAEPGRLLHISRICGELAVSRAIGDRDFKAAFNAAPGSGAEDGENDEDDASGSERWQCPFLLPYPDNHSGQFDGDLVSGVPEIRVMRVGGQSVAEEFLLLACDGLWDVMDADDAVRVTRGLLFDKGWSAKKAAARLAELAIHLGSSDNVTVIVIRFFSSRQTIEP